MAACPLFTQTVKEERTTTTFRHIRDDRSCEVHRRFISRMYHRFKRLGLADPQFAKSFPYEFHSRVWEMHLAYVLDRNKLKLIPSSRPGAGPDFGIRCKDGSIMWIEATAPGPGREPHKVRTQHDPGITYGGQTRETSLRYLHAIREKRDHYRRAKESGIIGEADGFVIAISGSGLGNEAGWEDDMHDRPLIVKLLFGLGEQAIVVPVGNDSLPPHLGEIPFEPEVTKSQNAKIASALFTDQRAAEISAMIFCPNHIKNRPRRLGSDFVLARNPYARRPFPPLTLRNGREWSMGLLGYRSGSRRPFDSVIVA